MDSEKLKLSSTTDGKPARPGFENASAPAPVDTNSGQHGAYWVLNEEERAKGFVRPVRNTYKHVGMIVCGKIEPSGRLGGNQTICSDIPGHDGPCFCLTNTVTQPEAARAESSHILGGCNAVTYMGRALAETYARDPSYYGATFCCNCKTHLPVGARGEFVWVDGGKETEERVGT